MWDHLSELAKGTTSAELARALGITLIARDDLPCDVMIEGDTATHLPGLEDIAIAMWILVRDSRAPRPMAAARALGARIRRLRRP